MRLLRSVRGRITVIAVALVAITLVVASSLIVRLVENDLRDAAENTVAAALVEQAARLDESSRFALIQGGDTFEFGVFEEAGELAFGRLFVDNDLAAEVEVNFTTGRINELLDPNTGETLAAPELLAELEELIFIFHDLDGDDGSQLLVGAASQGQLDVSTSAVRRALFMTVPVVVLAFALLTWWLVGRALDPVDAITDRVNDISTANLDERVPVPDSRDEVARLAIVMNQMLGRLEQGDERQRQFAANASHELRSPLATVRGAAEIIEVADDANTVNLAADIMAEVDRMDELIGDLLDLARQEANAADSLTTAVDLDELVHHVVTGSMVRIETEGNTVVAGDSPQLAGTIRNLIDNAERHAEAEVRIVVRSTGNSVELTVEDDGPGVAVPDREKVFERFVRLDEGRARDAGGAGLGLALVRSVVERHGGTVRVEQSSELGGAKFVVELPALS